MTTGKHKVEQGIVGRINRARKANSVKTAAVAEYETDDTNGLPTLVEHRSSRISGIDGRIGLQ